MLPLYTRTVFFLTQFCAESTVNMKNGFHALVLKYLDFVIHEEMVWVLVCMSSIY